MNNITELKPVCTVQNIINKFCWTIGMIPSSYKESLTYEEQLISIGNYLETNVIPALNNNALAVQELQNLFLQLKNYIENFIDNLDLQDEVNNKIDDMISKNYFNNDYFKIVPEPYMLYQQGSGYSMQGMAYGNNMIAQYYERSFPNGTLNFYNYQDRTFVSSSQIPAGHGNDMVFIDNNIYIVLTKSASGLSDNKTIGIYNTDTSAFTTINPFNSLTSYSCCFGITKFDNNTLIVALAKENDQFQNVAFAKWNIITNDITILPITNNTPNMNFYQYTQSIEYFNGKLYVLVSNTNALITFSVSENSLRFLNINVLGYTDTMGQPYGEFEGLTNDGQNLLLSSRMLENLYNSAQIIKVYRFNPNTNLPIINYSYPIDNFRNFIYVNNSANTNILFENGTTTYPYKTIQRAIYSLKSYPIPNIISIRVEGGSSYSLEKIDNANINMDIIGKNITFDCTNFQLNCSNINIEGNNKSTFSNFARILNAGNLYISNAKINITQQINLKSGNVNIKLSNCNISSSLSTPCFIVDFNNSLDVTNSSFTNMSSTSYISVLRGGKLFINNSYMNNVTSTNGSIVLFSANYAKYENVDIIPSTNITINYIQARKIGKLLSVVLSFTPNINIEAFGTIFFSIPSNANSVYIPLCNQTTYNTDWMYIIKDRIQNATPLTANTNYRCSFSLIVD